MIYIATTLAPAWARATSAACAMFAINLIGLGLLVYLPAALCFWLASRSYRADHIAALAVQVGAKSAEEN